MKGLDDVTMLRWFHSTSWRNRVTIFRWLESFGETFQSGWFKQIACSFRDVLCLLFSLLYILCPTDLDRPWSSCFFTWLVACLSYVEYNCSFSHLKYGKTKLHIQFLDMHFILPSSPDGYWTTAKDCNALRNFLYWNSTIRE